MTIVASNSITVSKVDDGTITHTAWSYSADGTDRFTTVYPNLNLLTGTSEPFVMGYGIPRTTWDATNKVSKISLPVTTTANEVLPQDTGFPYTYTPGVTYTQSIYISTDAPLTGTPIKFTWFTNQYQHNTAGVDKLVKVSTNIYRATSTYIWPSSNSPSTGRNADFSNLTQVFDFTKGTFLQFYKPKLELGSIATLYMQSASEVATADWPKYIGQYSDFMQADSTNPSDYTWGPMRGDDGIGVTSTVITYANSTSGTTAPSTGWTSSVPSLVKGQYLWTKTVWSYTDNSSETGYSVSYISKDGNNGTNGTSGIIVSSVAPASPQTGQLWQDTSTTPQLVKKWTGSSWVIWEFYAENLKANNISVISSNLGNMTAGSYTSWTISSDQTSTVLEGIYFYNGIFRTISIKDPLSTDPDTPNAVKGKYIKGYQVKSGETKYLNAKMPSDYTVTANQLLKGGQYWSDLTNVSAVVGSIMSGGVVGQILPDDDKRLTYSSPGHYFTGVGLFFNDYSIPSEKEYPVNIQSNVNYTETEFLKSGKRIRIHGVVQNSRYFTLELDLKGPALTNPDIGYRSFTAGTMVGSFNEGATNREWMLVVGLDPTLNNLLFRAYYRDGGVAWPSNPITGNSTYIYRITVIR